MFFLACFTMAKILKKKKKKRIGGKIRHACLVLKKRLFVPSTPDKLFKNSSAMSKKDPLVLPRSVRPVASVS